MGRRSAKDEHEVRRHVPTEKLDLLVVARWMPEPALEVRTMLHYSLSAPFSLHKNKKLTAKPLLSSRLRFSEQVVPARLPKVLWRLAKKVSARSLEEEVADEARGAFVRRREGEESRVGVVR